MRLNLPLHHRSGSALASGLVALTLLAGCGSSDAGATSVASLTGSDGTETAAVEATQDTAEAALAYVDCMGDNGIEMNDPTFDAEGNIEAGALFGEPGEEGGFDPRSEEFQAAQTACGDLADGIAFGGGRGGGRDFDNTAIEDGLLDYTACLRDEGLTVDDITFGGGPGGARGANADGAQPGTATDGAAPPADGTDGFQGERPEPGERGEGGAGGDPTARLTAQLGLDETDPEVAAALETCAPTLDEAFSGAAVAEAS